MTKFCPIFLLILAALLFGEQQNEKIKQGDRAPMFVLRDINNNYLFLNDFCGETLRKPYLNSQKYIVVISFFTTYCKPCQKEIPFLQNIQDEYSERLIKVFLVDLGEDRETVHKYLTKKPTNLPVLLDRYGVWGEKYGVESVPALFIIDQDGIIRFINYGFSSEEEFSGKIYPLLNELASGQDSSRRKSESNDNTRSEKDMSPK